MIKKSVMALLLAGVLAAALPPETDAAKPKRWFVACILPQPIDPNDPTSIIYNIPVEDPRDIRAGILECTVERNGRFFGIYVER